MGMKGWVITAGLGAIAGAVGIMMLSKSNPVRELALKAATKVEDAAWTVSEKLMQKMDM
ncbi:MAG: hypothetical protein IJO56_01130 [Oscillospiraceae bacterium]|nr:hypothetical protein [Oscillospiraceae bacterium]